MALTRPRFGGWGGGLASSTGSSSPQTEGNLALAATTNDMHLKTSDNMSTSGGIALIVLLGVAIWYLIWAWLKYGKVKEGAEPKHWVPNFRYIITVTATVIIGIPLLKIGFMALYKWLKPKTNLTCVLFNNWFVKPLATLVFWS